MALVYSLSSLNHNICVLFGLSSTEIFTQLVCLGRVWTHPGPPIPSLAPIQHTHTVLAMMLLLQQGHLSLDLQWVLSHASFTLLLKQHVCSWPPLTTLCRLSDLMSSPSYFSMKPQWLTGNPCSFSTPSVSLS